MQSYKLIINLNIITNIAKFVEITSNSPCEVLLISGKYVANGKSLLGICSLDLSRDVIVEIEHENITDIISLKDKLLKLSFAKEIEFS